MKIFRAKGERIQTFDTLVLAKNPLEAKLITNNALMGGEIEFSDIHSSYSRNPDYISVGDPLDISDAVLEEIKCYGILNEKGKLEYGTTIAKEIEEKSKIIEKEEWLKKNNMEFDFGK